MSNQARAPSAAAMEDLGRQAAVVARPGVVIALVGGLGAGKTHWTKGLVAALGGVMDVTSPTFSLVNEYHTGPLTVYHFDFYRLETAAEVLALGWDEYLDAGGLIVVEWADKFPALLPHDSIWWRFTVEADATRTVQRME
jgi:tRNA threonylcarbamoyladenosine biosynthesis protein TsaE